MSQLKKVHKVVSAMIIFVSMLIDDWSAVCSYIWQYMHNFRLAFKLWRIYISRMVPGKVKENWPKKATWTKIGSRSQAKWSKIRPNKGKVIKDSAKQRQSEHRQSDKENWLKNRHQILLKQRQSDQKFSSFCSRQVKKYLLKIVDKICSNVLLTFVSDQCSLRDMWFLFWST